MLLAVFLMFIYLISKTFKDSATSTLWRHVKKNHQLALDNQKTSDIETGKSAQEQEIVSL
jgi:hypothetical protein